MIKNLFNLANQRTQMLFIRAENLVNICWLSALLSAFCFALFLVGYKSMDNASKFLLISASFIFLILFIFSRRYLFHNIFSEIRKRCTELPVAPSSENTIQEYSKKKKWRFLGSLLFLLWIPVILLAEFMGVPVIKQDRSDVTALGWVICIGFVVVGFFSVLYGATCPACKKIGLINRQNKTCAHCGAQLAINKNKS